MRDFFIRALEHLIGFFVVIMLLAVVGGSIAVMATGLPQPNGGTVSGVGAGLFLLVVGLLYTVLIGGFMYLGVGIYHNTKRTAEAMELMKT